MRNILFSFYNKETECLKGKGTIPRTHSEKEAVKGVTSHPRWLKTEGLPQV